MHTRPFSTLGREVSEIGIGTWQLSGKEWGEVSDEQALDTLRAAADAGVTFIDTADIYGIGRSESIIGRFLKERLGPWPLLRRHQARAEPQARLAEKLHPRNASSRTPKPRCNGWASTHWT